MSLIAKTACAAVLFVATLAHAQTEDAPKCRMQNIATLALHDNGLNFSADGSVNGDKVSMLIDSGAQNTMVTKTEIVKLGLATPAAKGKKGAVDNRVALNEFAVGGIELHDTHILALQNLSDYPSFGAVIGADFLMQRDSELWLASRVLKFFNPLGCKESFIAYWDENAGAIPMESLSANDHRPLVTVEIDGRQMHALIDTATPISVINVASAARVGITPKSPSVTPMKGSGSSARTTGWLAPFHKFSIGGEDISNIKIPMLDLKNVVNADPVSATPDMILGSDFLRAHHVLLSVTQQKFYFSYVGGKVFNMDSSPTPTPATPTKQ